jgi:hypothetical protein
MNDELLILDFDKVKKEWIEEANDMTDLEKVKYYLKKIQENENSNARINLSHSIYGKSEISR